jgi:hypothetical protein
MIAKNCSWFCVLLCSTLLIAAGCGQRKGDLRGTVSFEGKKLAMGQVWVIGSDSLPYYGVIQDDGTYVVKGLPTGECRIAVNSPNPAETLRAGRGDSGRPVSTDREPGDPKKWIAIPERYNMHDTSKITCTITSGENTMEIKLSK